MHFYFGNGQLVQDSRICFCCEKVKKKVTKLFFKIIFLKYNFFFQGAGDIIPGGATLYFDIELIDTEDGPAPVNVFKQIDLDRWETTCPKNIWPVHSNK